MHQSIAALRSLRLLRPTRSRTCVSPLTRALSATPFGTGDPAVHHEDSQGEAAKSAAAEEEQKQRSYAEGKETTPTGIKEKMTTKSPPLASSPGIESSDVVRPRVDLTFQQKRRANSAAKGLDDVACVGWDGSPLRDGDWRATEEEEVEEYRKY